MNRTLRTGLFLPYTAQERRFGVRGYVCTSGTEMRSAAIFRDTDTSERTGT